MFGLNNNEGALPLHFMNELITCTNFSSIAMKFTEDLSQKSKIFKNIVKQLYQNVSLAHAYTDRTTFAVSF